MLNLKLDNAVLLYHCLLSSLVVALCNTIIILCVMLILNSATYCLAKSNEKTLEIEKLQNQLLTAQSSLQDCENCKTDLYKCQGRISLANQEL